MARNAATTTGTGRIGQPEPGDDKGRLLGDSGAGDMLPDDRTSAPAAAPVAAGDDKDGLAGGHSADDGTGTAHQARHFS